jgi:catechol 2,3-dioxygenase-like lactoylglutathione lyase family enzyme
MAPIKGIGGVFIDSNDAPRLAAWYKTVLGMELERHEGGFFHVFVHVDVESGIERENPVFAINPASGPLSETGRGFMLNFRVDDLDDYLADLTANGVEQDRPMSQWERGKHAWVRDIDGNVLELYEELLP